MTKPTSRWARVPLPSSFRCRAFLVLVVSVAPISASADAIVAPSWPQYRFDAAHTGHNPDEHRINASNVGQLRAKWEVTLGPGGLFAGMASSTSIVDGVAYVDSEDGYLYALDISSGTTLWAGYAAGGYGDSTPAVAAGVVYVGTIAGLYAFPTNCSAQCLPLWVGGTVTINPAVAVSDGVVYAPGYDGNLYAFDARTGAVLWTGKVNQADPIFDTPTIAEGTVYVPGDLGVYAFSTTCSTNPCKPKWLAPTPVAPIGSPAVHDGTLYEGDYNGTVYALDAASGKVQWKATVGPAPSSVAVAQDAIYIADSNGFLWSFPTTCSTRGCVPNWKASTGQSLYDPVVANGLVYVGSPKDLYSHGVLRAYPTTCSGTCAPLWTTATDGALESAPTVVGGVVYANTLTGQAYAYALPSP